MKVFIIENFTVMAKQIFNSFKELQSIRLESKSGVDDRNSTDVIKKRKQEANTATKPANKKAKKANQQFPIKLEKPIDPKLQAIFNALNWLKTTFPKAFINPPAKLIPLKIGIGQDIADFIKSKENPEFSLTIIRKALSMYTNNFRYLVASTKLGNPRIDLQGVVTGEITAEQAQYAEAKLQVVKERKKNKIAQTESVIQENDVVYQQNH